MVAEYHLNGLDIAKLCGMFKNGATTFEQIKQMAMSLYRQHQKQYAQACLEIAEKTGDFGEYHGFLGRDNPKR